MVTTYVLVYQIDIAHVYEITEARVKKGGQGISVIRILAHTGSYRDCEQLCEWYSRTVPVQVAHVDLPDPWMPWLPGPGGYQAHRKQTPPSWPEYHGVYAVGNLSTNHVDGVGTAS